MEYRKYGDTIYLRMDRGNEIIGGILEVCRREQIASAIFSGIGGCSRAELQTFLPELGRFETETLSGMLELVSLNGNVVTDEAGQYYHHTHAAFSYKDPEGKTDDLYFKVSKDGQTYEFTVEFYLCGQDTEVYKAVEALNVGDVVDLQGYLYWYNGANPHIIAVTKAA